MVFKAFKRNVCTVAPKILLTLGKRTQQPTTQQSRRTTRLSGMLLSCGTHALCLRRQFCQKARVVTVAFVWGLGIHLSRPAQVKTGIKGMLVEWSTQHARSVRVCAVLALHVLHPGIHTLWWFPCASIHSLLLSTGQKESACSCLPRRSDNIGLFKTLGLVLRCAVVRHFTLFLLQQIGEQAHRTHDALIGLGCL